MMRTTLKIILPLIVSVASVSLFFAAYQVRTEKRKLRNDLSRRAEILGESLRESVEPLLEPPPEKDLQYFIERFGQPDHLKGVAEFLNAEQTASVSEDSNGPIHIYALPLHRNSEIAGTLAVFHDTSYIDRQVSGTLRDCLLTAFVQTVLITGFALILVRWTFTVPLARTAKWLRAQRTGQPNAPPALSKGEILDEIRHEVTHLARDLNTARAAAEEEARLRDSNASLWTADRLHVSLRNKLQEKPLFVVSNREPYMHVFSEKDKSISVIVPASGVVTALEPVLRACNGTWIANGSGSADREAVDAHDRLRVPPDRPSYTLRRVWLSDEEEKGYYEGFSNEGLWPLCHIVHTRPIFRPEDW